MQEYKHPSAGTKLCCFVIGKCAHDLARDDM